MRVTYFFCVTFIPAWITIRFLIGFNFERKNHWFNWDVMYSTIKWRTVFWKHTKNSKADQLYKIQHTHLQIQHTYTSNPMLDGTHWQVVYIYVPGLSCLSQTTLQYKMCAQTNKHRRAPRRPKRRLEDTYWDWLHIYHFSK